MKKILILAFSLLSLVSYSQTQINPSGSNTVANINTAVKGSITATGTNTYVATMTGFTWNSGEAMDITFVNANSGTSTFNLNGTGALTLKKESSGSLVDLVSGDIIAGARKRFYHNGTYLVLQSGGGSGGVASVSGTANQIASTGGTTPVLSIATNPILPGAPTIASPGNSTQNIITTDATQTLSNKTLVAPALGTPTSGVGSNITGIVGTNVTNTPAGNIAATTSQAAINELDTEKASVTSVGSTIPIGNIINETFSNITNFTNVGSATFSVVSNALNIAGGSSKTLSNYLKHTGYGNTNCEEWTMSATVTVGTLSSTSFGVGFGVQGSSLAIQGALLLDNTDKGKLAFYFNNGTATELKSNGSIAISASDVITLTLVRTRHTFILTATNVTQSNISISHTLNIENNNSTTYRTPNAGNFAIYALGGTHTLDNFTVVLDAFTNPDILVLGDSFTSGSRSVNYNQRFSNRLQQLINGSVQVNAGGGNLVEEINATEALLYAPSKIVIFLGTNNKISAESDASIRTKLNTLISSLTGYTLGTNLWVCELPPNNTFDATSYNSGLATNYSAGLIGINKILAASSGTGANATLSPDGTHVNAEGHFLIANAIYTRLKGVLTKSKDVHPYDNPVYKISNKVGFGDQDHTPLYAIDVFTNGGTNQFRIGNSLNNDGGYLISNTSTQMMLSGGMYFDGALKPSSTTASSINLNTGLIAFRTDASLTAGTTFTPSTRGTFLTNGSFVLGSVQDATFRDTNGGADAQSPFTVYPSGSTISSGFASTMGVAGAWSFSKGNGTRQIRRASVGVVGPSDTPGAETGQLSFYTKPAASAITLAILIDENQNVVIGNSTAPVSKLDVLGSFGVAITTVTGNTTLDATHHTVLCDATSGNITITLPTASTVSRRIYIIKKIDASANTVSFSTTDGSITLTTQFSGKQIQSNGTSYYVVGSF